ncbi:hypothetical protein R1sor_009040 [Riccia sorocarpa]|uniref:Uncharacterized protein n=1 Tax=Riccia sorocarpa TaxID=122646 RepID=A0ABD3H6J1_9MARC
MEIRDTVLIKVIEKLLTPAYTAMLVIFVTFLWRDRCRDVFDRGPSSTPVKVILMETEKLAIVKIDRHLEGVQGMETSQYNTLAASSTWEDETRRMCRRGVHEGNQTRERRVDEEQDLEVDLNTYNEEVEQGVWETRRELKMLGFQEITVAVGTQLNANEAST